MTAPAFELHEIGIAATGALAVQAGFFVVLGVFVGGASIASKDDPPPPPIPITVKPVLDDVPLLKLGGKRVRAKLPDRWIKQAPVKRYEAKSAPSPEAEKTPDAIPTSELAEGDAQAPPPDAEIARKVDEDIRTMDASPDAVPANVDQEGHADGVEEGTETDPLKARAVSLYRAKIIGWFNARFRPPVGQVPCEELKRMSSKVSANVSPDRTVTGYTVIRPSGNAAFDARVQSAMRSAVGQRVPPPPPLYEDVLPPTILPVFQGASAKCE